MKAIGDSNKDRKCTNEDMWMIVSLHMWQKSDHVGLIGDVKKFRFYSQGYGAALKVVERYDETCALER